MLGCEHFPLVGIDGGSEMRRAEKETSSKTEHEKDGIQDCEIVIIA